MKQQKLVQLLLAFTAAIIVLSPKLYAFYTHGPFSETLFDDWDEPLYLTHHLRFGAKFLAADYTTSEWLKMITEVYHVTAPHVLVDLLVGKLLASAGFEATEAALALDLFCVTFSFLAAYTLFSLLLSKPTALTATIILLLFPWLGNLERTVLSQPFSLPTNYLTNEIYGFFPSVPAMRAVYTQISYPLFIFSFALLLKALTLTSNDHQSGSRLAFYAGISAGASLYLYFFTSVAAMLLALSLFTVLSVVYPRKFISSWLPLIKHFLLSATLVQLPGLLFLLLSEHKQTLKLTDEYRWVFNFSPFYFSALFATLVGLHFLKSDERKIFLSILPATFLATLACGLLQPLSGAMLTIYHFPVFYFFPVAGAIIVAATIEYGLSGTKRAIGNYVLITLSVVSFLSSLQPFSDDTELRELTSYLEKNNDSGRFEFFPHETLEPKGDHGFPLLFVKPFSLSSFSGFLFNEPDLFLREPRRAYRTELLYSILYRGRAEPFEFCPKASVSQVQLYKSPLGLKVIRRAAFCDELPNYQKEYSACSVVKEWSEAPVVWWEVLGEPGPHFEKFASNSWHSSGKRYRVYWLDKSKLVRHFCD